MNFASDNVHGVAPEIVDAMLRANRGEVPAYGEDELTRRVEARFAEIFEHEVAVCPVATGTAANSLALALLAPPWGAVLCHESAHVAVDEANAPEFYTGGAKLVPIAGADGKLRPETLEILLPGGLGVVHHAQPAALTLTQATEAGTVYRLEEIAALAGIAHRHGLAVHMDGARFANAVAALGAAPADLSWRAGIDVLSFGATKNGALAAEAVLLFDPARGQELAFRRKRGGHLFSKMRFLSAQLEAYLAEDLWLRNAQRANRAAARLAAGLANVPGARLRHPVEANEVFVELPETTIAALIAAGSKFYRWDGNCIRLVTAFDSSDDQIDRFVAAALGNAG